MIVIGCGGRLFEVTHKHKAAMWQWLADNKVGYLIHGDSGNSDHAWEEVARKLPHIQIIRMPVTREQWAHKGKIAGHQRNTDMATVAAGLDRIHFEGVTVASLPGGHGTRNMIETGKTFGFVHKGFK